MKETTKRKPNKVLIPITIVMTAFALTMLLWPDEKPQEPPMTKEKKLYAEHIRKQKKIESLFTYDRHLPSIALIQQRMNDPKSFDFISSRHWPLDSAGCVGVLTVYTGKNAFGGVIKQSCITYIDSTGAVFEVQFQ